MNVAGHLLPMIIALTARGASPGRCTVCKPAAVKWLPNAWHWSAFLNRAPIWSENEIGGSAKLRGSIPCEQNSGRFAKMFGQSYQKANKGLDEFPLRT